MEDPNFYLEGIVREKDELKDFEGPLSLILMLLQKNKIEIRDIVISDILEQYMEYLEQMQKMDLEVTSEFVRMASYLLYIKSKMLLTEEKEVTELEALIESLEQLKARDTLLAVKEVVPALGEDYRVGALIFSKGPEPLPACASEYRRTHRPAELLQALYRVFSSTEEKLPDLSDLRSAMPRKAPFSIRMKTKQILSRLHLRNLALNELYAECSSRSELVATFIAVLELCSIGSIAVSVSRKGDGYDLSFTGDGTDIDEILDRIEDGI